MARHRKYGEDLTYSQWHAGELSQLYLRIGHRLDMADRDFTEFCHFCKEPLLIEELVRDVGQNLCDKATTVTRRLAARSGLNAYLVAWRVNRSRSIQCEIDELHERILDLEDRTPIVQFTVRQLYPRMEPLQVLTPREWADWILISHRQHHAGCPRANDFPVHKERFSAALQKHPLHRCSLFDGL